MKRCSDCGVEKTLDQFYTAKGFQSGIMSRCKTCHLSRCKQNRLNRDASLVNAKARERYLLNPGKGRAWSASYKKRHPEKNQESKRIHRARKYGSGGRHTEEEWRLLCLLTGGVCARCGRPGDLSRDHIVPLTKGGSDDISNIQPLCRPCNSAKGNRAATNYLTGESHASILKIPAGQRKRRRESYAVAEYLLTDPNGVQHKTLRGLRAACKDLGLRENGIRQVACGARPDWHGWTVVKIRPASALPNH